MREKLNENPKAQVALVAILVVVAGFLFISMKGGGEEEESSVGATEATVAVAGTSATGTATGATPGEAVEGAVESAIAAAGEAGTAAPPASLATPPPPAPVTAAYNAGRTVVLLIVHDGGIDDKLVKRSSAALSSFPDVALFTVPARQIARYAAITVGLEVNRVPALVVMRPKRLSDGTPQASVDYGFQTPQGVAQAVRDAAYNGRELTYHPD
ncbi:MAG TPA: hypothetical protein VG898_03940 [Solirubrobacterales bacterium]|nr:hypothetical protein [Solirubrobacterales bacterium]